MSDILSRAVNRAKAVSLGNRPGLAESSAERVQNIRESSATTSLTNLPLNKDTSLLKRQKEAIALELKAKVSEENLINRDNIANSFKESVRNAISIRLPSRSKSAVTDRKILDELTLARQLKSLYRERGRISRENLKKGRELFSYPINKVAKISLDAMQPETPPPVVPTIPRIPFKTDR
jgi:hypothetical protein